MANVRRLVCAHLITIGIKADVHQRTHQPKGGQSEGLFPRRLRVRNCRGVRDYEARARHHTGAIGNEETIKIINIAIPLKYYGDRSYRAK